MKAHIIFLEHAFCAIAALIILAGCSADSGGGSILAPSSEPVRLGEIKLNFNLLRISCDGVAVVQVGEANVEGMVSIQMENEPKIFKIEFIDKNGDITACDDKNYCLGCSFANPQIATFALCDELTKWQFYILGEKAGNTAFKLYFKNKWGFLEYSSSPIPLDVK